VRRSLLARLDALEDRRFDRTWRAQAREFGLTPDETAEYLDDLRRVVARLRAGLPPPTVADMIVESADRLGLTGDERGAFVAEMTAEVEARQAGQANEV
jgi:hypothetical protein